MSVNLVTFGLLLSLTHISICQAPGNLLSNQMNPGPSQMNPMSNQMNLGPGQMNPAPKQLNQMSNRNNPLKMVAGNVRVCGETYIRFNTPQYNAAGLPSMQPSNQLYQNPMFARQSNILGLPSRQQTVFGVQASPLYLRRVKRQAVQQPGYQPAFVPDLSHLQRNQGTFMPQQTFPQQQQLQPGITRQQRFLGPQQPGLQNLLHILEPPDPPDLPDYPAFGSQRQFNGRHYPRPGPGVPQPGLQIPQRPQRPNNPMASVANPASAPHAMQPLQIAPQVQQPQRQMFNPPINAPRQPSGLLSAQVIRSIAASPMFSGIDTFCVCTDIGTCRWLEGNRQAFATQCAMSPPPNLPPTPFGEICCCLG